MLNSNDLKNKIIIDTARNGCAIRLYTTDSTEKAKDAWGDDWDDVPYEHNAGEVYERYVDNIIDIHLPFDVNLIKPEDNWQYEGNSPYAILDFMDKKVPAIIISYDELWNHYIHKRDSDETDAYKILSKQPENVNVYHNMTVKELVDELKNKAFDIVDIKLHQ